MKDYLRTLFSTLYVQLPFAITGYFISENLLVLAGVSFGIGITEACVLLARLIEKAIERNK